MIERKDKSVISIQLDLLLVLGVLSLMSAWYYGVRAMLVIVLSVAVCFGADMLCIKLRGSKWDRKSDLSAVICGFVLALMMPASVPYEILIAADLVAIIIGKQAFGGAGKNIFNPMAVGFVFAAFCWKDAVMMYPRPMEALDLSSQVNSVLYESLTSVLNIAKVPSISDFDILLGKFTGPMGATHIVVLLVCAFVLMFRRSVSALTFCSGLSTALIFAAFFPKYGDSLFSSLGYELVSGMLVYGMIFLACDYQTSPKTRSSRFIYGVLIALISIAFRSVGKIENSIVYAVLIANPLSISLDKSTISFSRMMGSFVSKLKAKFSGQGIAAIEDAASEDVQDASAPANYEAPVKKPAAKRPEEKKAKKIRFTMHDDVKIAPRKATKRRKSNGRKKK